MYRTEKPVLATLEDVNLHPFGIVVGDFWRMARTGIG
jgi:hypothetical protein